MAIFDVPLPIYVYGNTAMVHSVLQAVSQIMSIGGGMAGMVKAIAYIGVIVAVVSYAANPGRMVPLGHLVALVLVYTFLFLPVTKVGIYDKSNRLTTVKTLDNVPAALAMVASLTSSVGFAITVKFESSLQALPELIGVDDGGKSVWFHPNCADASDCFFNYSQGGLNFGGKLMARFRQVSERVVPAMDELLEEDTLNFVQNCTAFDLSQHRIEYADLAASTDTWATMKTTSEAHYVMEGPKASRAFKACTEAYASLTGRRDAVAEAGSKYMAASLFPSMNEADGRAALSQAFGDVANATKLGDAAANVKSYLLQNMAINQVKRGLGRAGLEAGSPSAVMLAQAEAATMAATNASFISQARLAEEALPLIRNGVEAILYGIFPIAALMFMALSGASLAAAIKGYVLAFVWIQLWPPLYTLVNFIGQSMAINSMRVMAKVNAAGAGVSFANYSDIYNGQLSDQAVIGYLVVAIPVVASGIIYGMNSAAGVLGGGSFMSGTQRAAEAAGSGNVLMGNVKLQQQLLGPSRVDADHYTYHTAQGVETGQLTAQGLQTHGYQMSSVSLGISAQVGHQYAQSLGKSSQAHFSNSQSEAKEYAASIQSAAQQVKSSEHAHTSLQTFMQTDAGQLALAKGRQAGEGANVGKASEHGTGTQDGQNFSGARTTYGNMQLGLSGFGSSLATGIKGERTDADQIGASETTSIKDASGRSLTVGETAAVMQAWAATEQYSKSDSDSWQGKDSFQASLSEGLSHSQTARAEFAQGQQESAMAQNVQSIASGTTQDWNRAVGRELESMYGVQARQAGYSNAYEWVASMNETDPAAQGRMVTSALESMASRGLDVGGLVNVPHAGLQPTTAADLAAGLDPSGARTAFNSAPVPVPTLSAEDKAPVKQDHRAGAGTVAGKNAEHGVTPGAPVQTVVTVQDKLAENGIAVPADSNSSQPTSPTGADGNPTVEGALANPELVKDKAAQVEAEAAEKAKAAKAKRADEAAHPVTPGTPEGREDQHPEAGPQGA